MKHVLQVEIPGSVGVDPESYRTAFFCNYIEVRKEDSINSIAFYLSRPASEIPLSRASARALANDVLRLLGPEDEEERTSEQQYRHPRT
jgi:hypothetical protein